LPFLQKNLFFRTKSEDRYTFFEVFLKECYDVKTFFSNKDVKNIIDAGANAGFATLDLRRQFPEATIVAIEPEDGNFDILLKNVQKDARIKALKTALWYESTFLKIAPSNSNRNFSVTATHANDSDCFAAISIQDILQNNNWTHIDVLKIDIEGAEKEVFSKNYEQWLPYTKCIVMEIHDDMKKGCSRAVFSAIAQYNFSTYIKDGNFIFINEATI
jgi:FkbM family methyltransferase